MKKNTLVLISFFSVGLLSAQEVVSTQGDSYSSGVANIDFTIGEVVIDTGTDGSNDLTQGFHQTNWTFVSVQDHVSNYEVDVYPNPTQDLLKIQTGDYNNVSYTLFDSQGRIVLQNQLISDLTTIQVAHLATGTYTLRLNNKEENLKTFTLIKTY
jgi:hypothetical protein